MRLAIWTSALTPMLSVRCVISQKLPSDQGRSRSRSRSDNHNKHDLWRFVACLLAHSLARSHACSNNFSKMKKEKSTPPNQSLLLQHNMARIPLIISAQPCPRCSNSFCNSFAATVFPWYLSSAEQLCPLTYEPQTQDQRDRWMALFDEA